MDGLSLAYHRPSGTTHILASPAPEILAALRQGPSNAAGLIARLEASHGIVHEGDISAMIEARLQELVIAGLIWRA